MEATLLDIPAIALSQDFHEGQEIPWATSEAFALDAIRRLLRLPWPNHTLFNVNFPAVDPPEVGGFAVTFQGKRAIADNLTEGIDPRGQPYYWIGPIRETRQAEPGSDVAAVAAGCVSVTPIYLDLTNVPVLNALKKVFD
jgi:5'-nucleotidase